MGGRNVHELLTVCLMLAVVYSIPSICSPTTNNYGRILVLVNGLILAIDANMGMAIGEGFTDTILLLLSMLVMSVVMVYAHHVVFYKWQTENKWD